MAKAKTFKIRRVGSRDERQRPSVFMRLKVDEQFVGYAMFEPNPDLEGNSGWLEYYVHNDQRNKTYVPCAGEDCPFCAANDNPWTRSLSTWYFPDAKKGEKFKVFEFNGKTSDILSDEAEDEEGLLGKKMRVKRISDKGDYTVKVRKDKPLTQKELKKLIAEMDGEIDLEEMINRKLNKQIEVLAAQDALSDDDDDEDDDEDEEDEPKSKKGKKLNKKSTKDEDEDDDEEDEDSDEDEDDDEDEEDEDESEDDEEDEDEDDEDSEDEDEEDEAEDSESGDEDNELVGQFIVKKTNEDDETFDFEVGKVESGDLGKKKNVKMWLGDKVTCDWDELKKGTKVNVTALQDEEGDYVVTEINIVKRGRPKKK